jgi:hypothetical protein
MAYYLNAGMLAAQYAHLASLAPEIKAHLRLIVVDDGSPRDAALAPAIDPGFPVDVYRILVDVRWNQDACRNLAADRAQTEWLLLTDMDHLVPEATFAAIMGMKLDAARVYRFARVSAPAMEAYKPHPNSWLLTRALYDRMGGYDEALAGFYGTDADFRDRVNFYSEIVQLKEPLVRVPREIIPDASTTTYERKTEADRIGIPKVRALRGEGWRPLRLSFPWARIA